MTTESRMSAEQVAAIRFTPARLVQGHRMKEVDDFLDAMRRATSTQRSRD